MELLFSYSSLTLLSLTKGPVTSATASSTDPGTLATYTDGVAFLGERSSRVSDYLLVRVTSADHVHPLERVLHQVCVCTQSRKAGT